MRVARAKQIISEETRKKMSEIAKSKGYGKWMKGRHASEETKRKLSEQRKGEKHPNWLGGKSFEPYTIEFNEKLKEKIRKKYNYRCQECFREQSELITKTNKSKKLTIHHIDYNKKNNIENNLIPLCNSCHSQTNFKREDWTNYLKKRSLQ